MRKDLVELQAEYYSRTANSYDNWHSQEGDEHFVALKYISALSRSVNATSFLDVGAGTGRGIGYILNHHPQATVMGIEPVSALRQIGIERHGIPEHCLRDGSGLSLPFPDKSFDVVFELGVLHHVKEPNLVVSEMLRVASKAVFLSDENRFAHGRLPARMLKVLLWKSRLFWPFYAITRGKTHRYSQGDGIAYSYSVYDALPLLSAWSDRTLFLPLDRNHVSAHRRKRDTTSLVSPLLTSFHLLIGGMRDLE